MSEDLIESQNRAKRHYEPLNISKSLACVTPGSPLLQVYENGSIVPSPNRKSVYSVIAPIIEVTTADNSWDIQRSNIALANIVWYSNEGGKWNDISSLSSWTGNYEIDLSSTTNRGRLTIKKNLGVNDKEQLYMEADLMDYRTGSLLHLVFDAVTLSALAQGEDTYGISVDGSSHVIYNPFLDKLDLYDFKVANGLQTASDAARAACVDNNCYERTISIKAWKGKSQITSGYTLEVARMDDGKEVALSVDAMDELKALSLTSIILDLRIVENADYMVNLKVGGVVKAKKQISVTRDYPPIEQPQFANVASINWGEINRHQRAVFAYNNKIVDSPQRLVRMLWKTKAYNGNTITEKTWNEGETFEYAIGDTGLGDLESDSVNEIVAYAQKKAHSIAADASGNYYGDSNGNVYIIR